jgi:predicted homoserine dehydrogenase-like protein
MLILDTALQRREAAGRPVRVGLIGAGFMGRALANQILHGTTGLRLAVVANRHVDRAVSACAYADPAMTPVHVSTPDQLDDAIRDGRLAVTDDPGVACRAAGIDVLVDVTGAVEYGARVALDAFAHGKHLVLMNAELDATLGPILQIYARRHGVILSACDGDQPGVEINLCRFVRGLGLIPRVLGNIKGLHDRYRTPATQRAFAERWGQSPSMVTSFADGSKVNFEQAVVANAVGMRVAARGMIGLEHRGHVDALTTAYDVDELRALGGIVEYVVGASPGPGVFCLAEHTDPRQRHYLQLYKLGEGPLYSFYTPYHLCHFEVPNTIARVVLFGDAAGAAQAPHVEVCAVAKRDLDAGEVLDDYGHYRTYGEAVNSDEMRLGRYLPEGLVEGCRLRHAVPRDQVLTFDDVVVPPGRVGDRLYDEQQAYFAQGTGAAVPAAADLRPVAGTMETG